MRDFKRIGEQRQVGGVGYRCEERESGGADGRGEIRSANERK